MRALLVTNAFATTTDELVIDNAAQALAHSLALEIVATTAPGDAIDFGASAGIDSYDIVICLGGDGTANEIINGLMALPDERRPIFASLPGGNANVLARNLGFEKSLSNAVPQLLSAIQREQFVCIGLGHVVAKTETDQKISRYFAFNAGLGIDAAVMAAMHELRNRGKKASDAKYAWIALRKVFRWVRKSSQNLQAEKNNFHFAFILNMSPWTYVSSKALNPAPTLTNDQALNIYAAKSATLKAFVSVLSALTFGRDFATVASLQKFTDQKQFNFEVHRAQWLQVDGEPLAKVSAAQFTHHPDTLRVVSAKLVDSKPIV